MSLQHQTADERQMLAFPCRKCRAQTDDWCRYTEPLSGLAPYLHVERHEDANECGLIGLGTR